MITLCTFSFSFYQGVTYKHCNNKTQHHIRKNLGVYALSSEFKGLHMYYNSTLNTPCGSICSLSNHLKHFGIYRHLRSVSRISAVDSQFNYASNLK